MFLVQWCNWTRPAGGRPEGQIPTLRVAAETVAKARTMAASAAVLSECIDWIYACGAVHWFVGNFVCTTCMVLYMKHCTTAVLRLVPAAQKTLPEQN